MKSFHLTLKTCPVVLHPKADIWRNQHGLSPHDVILANDLRPVLGLHSRLTRYSKVYSSTHSRRRPWNCKMQRMGVSFLQLSFITIRSVVSGNVPGIKDYMSADPRRSMPVNIVNGTHPQLVAYLVLYIWPSHLGLPILLAIILFSNRVRRHPTFTNFVIVFMIVGL